MRALGWTLVAWLGLLPGSALAEFQLSVYGGANTANDSDVTLDAPPFSGDFDVDWSGDSFNSPPYYGFRGTYWLAGFGMPNWGVALDFTHAKVKADLDDPDVGGTFERLEFTNGLNSVTLNGLYRFAANDRLSLYGGVGAGVSVPHVEVDFGVDPETFEYQVTGPVVQGLLGASVYVGHGFSVFGEYKASHSWNDADLDSGGSLETDILVHHFAAGVSFSFGGPAQH
jgi:lipid A oxidase